MTSEISPVTSRFIGIERLHSLYLFIVIDAAHRRAYVVSCAKDGSLDRLCACSICMADEHRSKLASVLTELVSSRSVTAPIRWCTRHVPDVELESPTSGKHHPLLKGYFVDVFDHQVPDHIKRFVKADLHRRMFESSRSRRAVAA